MINTNFNKKTPHEQIEEMLTILQLQKQETQNLKIKLTAQITEFNNKLQEKKTLEETIGTKTNEIKTKKDILKNITYKDE